MKAPEWLSAGQAASLQAENERLANRVRVLEARTGQLMVDGDRREQRAREEAHDCAAHGREIQYLRHMASWQWDHAQESASAYRGLVSALILVRQRITDAPVAPGVLSGWLDKAIAAGNRHIGKGGYPSLANCQRAGGCDHDGLSDGLRADIAEALGIAAPAPVAQRQRRSLKQAPGAGSTPARRTGAGGDLR